MVNFYDSVVLITGIREGYLGTGFVVHHDEQGDYVVTCAHVVRDVGGEIGIKVEHEEADVIAIGTSPAPDLAVLRVQNLGRNPLKLSTTGNSGMRFTISGVSSFLQGQVQYKSYMGNLAIPGKLGFLDYLEHIRIWDLKVDSDEEIKHGHSGAPVIDEISKRVIGVVSARQGENRGIAIAIEHLIDVWENMPSDLVEKDELDPTNTIFDYSCYVSYFLDGSKTSQDFVQELVSVLGDYINRYSREKKKIYIESAIRRGDSTYAMERALAICRSVCMIIVFSPPYFREPYCVREYLAMKTLEKQRVESMRANINERFEMIIPITYTGRLYPDELNRHPFNRYDFSQVALKRGRMRIENRNHLACLDEIARYIQELDTYFNQFGVRPSCKNFLLPSELEALAWQRTLPPMPPPKLGWR